ncbi:gamma-interferon-inducible lysosomal thiol reductase-like [Dermacentor andersoni]|uniref:gamma-interferon-inducible lysosomal thiol reductase-like n=1 Tax=Dermacentor andersoni TaxID=34620 RepID=UPI0024170BAA|nr:gamma-interferon-inducible lysosomal thiol reductase-like [Dermacentor andersoni]
MKYSSAVIIASVVLTACAVSPLQVFGGPARTASPINATLFYEGLCPACHRFILQQLWPTYGKLEDYITLDLLPFGNAHMKVDNGTVTFTCQHGVKECYVNEVQTCAVKYVHPTRKLLDFVACMFLRDDPTQAGEPCARKVGTDWPVLARCSRGPEGTELMYEMGNRTRGHQPSIDYVPWLELNGVHNETMAKRASKDLFGLLCELLGPEKPYVCQNAESMNEYCFS